jgi:hypothetical protein
MFVGNLAIDEILFRLRTTQVFVKNGSNVSKLGWSFYRFIEIVVAILTEDWNFWGMICRILKK